MSNSGGRAWAWSMLLVIGALAGCIGDDAAEDEHDHSEHDHGLETEGMQHMESLAPTLGFDLVFGGAAAEGDGTADGNDTAEGNATADGNATEAAAPGLVTFYADVLLCLPGEHGDEAEASDANATEPDTGNETADGTTDGNGTADGNATTDGNETVPGAGQTAVFDGHGFACPEHLAPEEHDGNETMEHDGNETAMHPAGPFDYTLSFGDGNDTFGTHEDFPLEVQYEYVEDIFTPILEITFADADPLVGAITIDLAGAPSGPPSGQPLGGEQFTDSGTALVGPVASCTVVTNDHPFTVPADVDGTPLRVTKFVIVITEGPTALDLDADLIDPDGNVIGHVGSFELGAGETFEVTGNHPPGDYTLEIQSCMAVAGSYDITIDTTYVSA